MCTCAFWLCKPVRQYDTDEIPHAESLYMQLHYLPRITILAMVPQVLSTFLGTHPSALPFDLQGSKSTKRGKYSYGAPACQQQVEKQQETVIMLDPYEDEATITSLEGSCSDYHPGWDTLGGGCDVLCDHTSDLLRINLFASKSMAFGSTGSGAPVQCRWGLGGLRFHGRC